jgi:hypothetical protein
MSTSQRDELLTQSEIFEKETLPPAKEGDQHAEAEPDEKRSGKYVGRFWSSPAFSNPQPNPQKVCLI